MPKRSCKVVDIQEWQSKRGDLAEAAARESEAGREFAFINAVGHLYPALPSDILHAQARSLASTEAIVLGSWLQRKGGAQ